MNDYGISKLDLKRRNRMQILRVIRENGPISRVDISAMLHITRAAVTIITNEMIAQSILEEVGEEPQDPSNEIRKGRRKILLDINPTYRFALGVYIDEASISIGLTTLNAQALDKRSLTLEPDASSSDITEQIAITVRKMLQNSCLHVEDIVGIGIGVMPSMWNRVHAVVKDGNLDFSELEQAVEQACNLPVYIGNAISLFAMASINYAEHYGQPVNQVFLHAGPVFHIAVIQNNQLVNGFQRYTHVVERFCVHPNGKALDGYPNGSVKAELSKQSMVEDVATIYGKDETPALYALTEGDMEAVSLPLLLTAWDQGDLALESLVKHYLDMLCCLLINVLQAYFAQKVYLHNFGFNERHLEQIRQHMASIVGEAEADRIALSAIEERYHFMCGCCYAIQHGFFMKGGMMERSPSTK